MSVRRSESEAVRGAAQLMDAFAERTGLTSALPAKRYLWTDAFAVCNFLALERASGDALQGQRALQLIDQVHDVLGRHRSDDPRAGMRLSGLDDQEGKVHPTRGGLRIGKPVPERASGEIFDAQLEWERDGQYFHYLTTWMHALDQTSRFTRQSQFNCWARELARTAHDAFAYGPPGDRHLFWKMTIALDRPLVPSEGQHDALDGLITLTQLQTTAAGLSGSPVGPDLTAAITDFAQMSERAILVTSDPLGLGGLLTDAVRVSQLMREGAFTDGVLLNTLLATALAGLSRYARNSDMRLPPRDRLAFRELGLSIGLRMLDSAPDVDSPKTGQLFNALASYRSLGDAITAFWQTRQYHSESRWTEHRDINEVMLATALVPEGFLILPQYVPIPQRSRW
jgi:hypothetical protein